MFGILPASYRQQEEFENVSMAIGVFVKSGERELERNSCASPRVVLVFEIVARTYRLDVFLVSPIHIHIEGKAKLMAVDINLVYEGQLHCVATHGPSGATLATDALGACVMTIMAISAEKHQFDLTGTRIHVTKEMIQQPVRRIGRLAVTVTVPLEKAALLSGIDRSKLETAARHCPVHQSLHPDIDAPIRFSWEG